MPTNLPPEYFEVDKLYRAARSPEEKAELLEELIGTIPKHKGTDHLRADLRRKLSKLREASQRGKSTGRRLSAFHIDKEGAGQVVVIGQPNVGKSALVTALTNATPEVSASPRSTWTPTPGMMEVDNVQIQLVDTPPLDREFVDPEFPNLLRRCDLILLVVDLQADPFEQLEETAALLEENRIVPLHLKERHAGQPGLVFKPVLVLVNKSDDESLDEHFQIFNELMEGDWPLIPLSARTGRNLDRMKRAVFEQLGIMRIYSKAPGKQPDFSTPFVVQKGSTVEEFAGKIHKDFYDNLKAARVWGSAQYDGQMVKRDHVLQDGDVVELRI
jgi:ribosome-interacting GTPase 1